MWGKFTVVFYGSLFFLFLEEVAFVESKASL